MTLYRLKLRPRSPWRTPWQADTLTGMMLASCARTQGADVLRNRLIEPMLAGHPPFVLSDACPGDLLPMPIWLRLANYDDRKRIKRARWLAPENFEAARHGQIPAFNALIPDDAALLAHSRQHNTLSRLNDATGDADQGLAPYSRSETLLADSSDYLSVYIRIADSAAGDLLLDLFHELSLTGFGADTATGRGQFEIEDDPEMMPTLHNPPENANAVMSLSTFQPGPDDPTDGFWDAFPKFGKLGPELAAHADEYRKNTLILFRCGACFHSQNHHEQLGRAIPMSQLLPQLAAKRLERGGYHIIHPAFALTIPVIIPGDLP